MNAASGTRAPRQERPQAISLRSLCKQPTILALTAFLALTACGGDDGSPELIAAPQLAAPQPSAPTTGCTVSISQSDSICSTKQTRINVPLIRASRETCIAPCGVFFDAALDQNLGTQRPIHELSYLWSFGDPNARFEALPADFPESFKDANAAQGPLAGHVFERAGRYGVKLSIANRNQGSLTDTVTITVEDPETAYAGARTICHSNSGNFSGCPSGAQRFTSAVAAIGAVNQNRMRVLFRSGEETLFNADTSFSGLRDIQIGPFGSGPKPILRINGSISVNKHVFTPRETDGLTIFGLDIRGDYDPRTGMGENFNESGLQNIGNLRNTTIFRNKFSGLQQGVVFVNNPVGVIVADNEITDWYLYGAFDAAPNRAAYIGNSIKQNPAAVSGPGGTDQSIIPRWADQGPIRTERVTSLVIAQNDMFSNTGWSSDGRAHQPTIRYNTSGALNHFGVINRNRLEGGFHVVMLNTQNSSTTGNVGNAIFERNILSGTNNTDTFISMSFGGTTIRNNIAVMPDVINTLNSFWAFALYDPRPTTVENSRAPVVIAGNTIVQLQSRSPQTFRKLRQFESWANANFREVNNLVYAPRVPNSTEFPNYLPLNQNDYYRPLAGSSAIGSAAPDGFVFDTLDGKFRAARPSVGALEPSQ